MDAHRWQVLFAGGSSVSIGDTGHSNRQSALGPRGPGWTTCHIIPRRVRAHRRGGPAPASASVGVLVGTGVGVVRLG